MNDINLELERKMNLAIGYLANALMCTGHNSKPVLLHSIRIGFYLHDERYSEEVILGGLLHDILEDTEITEYDLKKDFGENVSSIVAANSYNTLIYDKVDQFIDMFNRCRECGKEALIIKAVDILDNSNYIQFSMSKEMQKFLLFKMKSFIDISKELIEGEKVWIKLNEKYKILFNDFNHATSDEYMEVGTVGIDMDSEKVKEVINND